MSDIKFRPSSDSTPICEQRLRGERSARRTRNVLEAAPKTRLKNCTWWTPFGEFLGTNARPTRPGKNDITLSRVEQLRRAGRLLTLPTPGGGGFSVRRPLP